MTAVIDTNVLLLLAAAPYLQNRLGSHKRLRAYTYSDYEMLRALLEEVGPPLLAPPHVLAEASNLIVHGVGDPDRTMLRRELGRWISAIEDASIGSGTAVGRMEYLRLGLTDAVLLCLAEAGGTLITADIDLFDAAIAHAYPAKNFNHYIDTL